jgi:hypothetical protein
MMGRGMGKANRGGGACMGVKKMKSGGMAKKYRKGGMAKKGCKK